VVLVITLFFASMCMINNVRMRQPIRKAALASILFAGALLAVAVTVEAQQPGKIFRIGYLDPSTISGSAALLETFRQELSKLGWIEGKNITIEYRFAENKGSERCVSLRRTWFALRLI
jgi:hypothetical protein